MVLNGVQKTMHEGSMMRTPFEVCNLKRETGWGGDDDKIINASQYELAIVQHCRSIIHASHSIFLGIRRRPGSPFSFSKRWPGEWLVRARVADRTVAPTPVIARRRRVRIQISVGRSRGSCIVLN